MNAETAAGFISGRYAHFLYWPNVYSAHITAALRHAVKVLHALGDPAPYSREVASALSGWILQAIVCHTCQILLVKLIYVDDI